MAGQRWGEPQLQRGRHPRGRAGLGLALSLLLMSACGDGGATGPQRPDGDGATSGTGGPTERLVGIWRTILVVEVPGDIQTWTTTWRFEPDADCLQTVETESLAEGFPRVTERPCTFVARDFDVTISFTDGGTVVFAYSFAGFSPDRLILDGFEYQRLA